PRGHGGVGDLGGDVRARLEAGQAWLAGQLRGGGMTRAGWRRIAELFAGAIRSDPAGPAPARPSVAGLPDTVDVPGPGPRGRPRAVRLKAPAPHPPPRGNGVGPWPGTASKMFLRNTFGLARLNPRGQISRLYPIGGWR